VVLYQLSYDPTQILLSILPRVRQSQNHFPSNQWFTESRVDSN